MLHRCSFLDFKIEIKFEIMHRLNMPFCWIWEPLQLQVAHISVSTKLNPIPMMERVMWVC